MHIKNVVSGFANEITHEIKLKNRHKCSEIRKARQNELGA
jgi:hypothetical protein